MADRFVWLRHPYGLAPYPERWPADAPAGCLQPDRLLAVYPLAPEDTGLSLDELAAKYPPPEQQQEAEPCRLST